MLGLYLFTLDFCVLRTDPLRTRYRLKALNTAYQKAGITLFYRSQILQCVRYTKYINIAKRIAKLCDK